MTDVTTDTRDVVYDENHTQHSASDVVVFNQTDYIHYIIQTQIPCIVDGLKKLYQRFIHAGSQGKLNTDQVKAVNAIGLVLNYHPHGDASVYDGIVRMAQNWHLNPPLARFDGNVGNYSGDNAAASRYVEVALTPFAKALFYRGINLIAIPLTRGEAVDFEPQYYIPALPTSLLYPVTTIGYGYGSKTAALTYENLCNLVALFARHKSHSPHLPFPYKDHIDLFIPTFPTYGHLINEAELMEEYSKGNWLTKILLDGFYEIRPDEIVIKTLPYGLKFEELRGNIEAARKVKGSPLEKKIDNVNPYDESDSAMGHLSIRLKRGVDPFEFWEELRVAKVPNKNLRVLQIYGSYVPNPNFSLNGELYKDVSPIVLLEYWYKARYTALLSTKRRDLQSLKKQQWTLEAQLTIVDHRDAVVEIIKKNHRDEARLELQRTFKLTRFQSECLLALRLESLSRSTPEELKTQLANIMEKIHVVTNAFTNINEDIAQTALKLKEEFSCPPHTTAPKYIGYVELDNQGYVQYESFEELKELASLFSKGTFKIHRFKGEHRIFINPLNQPSNETMHKYGRGRFLSFKTDPKKSGHYTVKFNDGVVCFTDKIVPTVSDGEISYSKRTARGIERNGRLSVLDLKTAFSYRKDINGRGAASPIVKIYPNFTMDYFSVVFNTEEKNTLYLQKVTPDQTKLVISPVGQVDILFDATGKNWLINIDDRFTNRCAARCIVIRDAQALLGETAKRLKIDLNSAKTKKSPLIDIVA